MQTVPDSSIARGALELAGRHMPPWLIAHAHRTFQFGHALLATANIAADVELLFVASMLHDVALGTDVADPVADFQVVGAEFARTYVARNHVDQAGRTPEDSDRVGDAVRLHLELTSADDPRPEVAGVHLGAALDVIGLRLDQLAPAVVDEIVQLYPRTGFAGHLSSALAVEASLKPRSRLAELDLEFDFINLVRNRPDLST